jgi:NAD-dependent dihydropyrimidine dehydrogenase PreA subunit
MIHIAEEKCTGCGFCMRDCPVGAVTIHRKKAGIDRKICVSCGVCVRVCPESAVSGDAAQLTDIVVCDACPIKCQVPVGAVGACQRYLNDNGHLVRTAVNLPYTAVKDEVGPRLAPEIQTPIITAIGAGTSYPCCKPAPGIVSENRGGVDVVTVVTEVPLSYSSILLKIDTDVFIGREGAEVMVGKRVVGMVETEQYGSKMLHIGGVNRLTGPNGFLVARTVTDIANRKPVKLKIAGGSRLAVQVGQPPEIDGKPVKKMRVGCGSATLGIFAPLLKEAADEVIVLDSHITGQLSQHVAGTYVGVNPTGVSLVFTRSTPGRYFGDHGAGWGGTSITDPAAIVSSIDMAVGWPGMAIFVTETTGENGAMFRVDDTGSLVPVPLTEKAQKALAAISDACEPSLVSAMYTAGSGGSARAGVTRYPIKLTRAIHENKAVLTVGGAPGYVMPGGGISFMVDVGKIRKGSFYWTPTPATICPLEYTMTVADYREMGGHIEAMKPFDAADPENDG